MGAVPGVGGAVLGFAGIATLIFRDFEQVLKNTAPDLPGRKNKEARSQD
jgi:hypothetical protein